MNPRDIVVDLETVPDPSVPDGGAPAPVADPVVDPAAADAGAVVEPADPGIDPVELANRYEALQYRQQQLEQFLGQLAGVDPQQAQQYGIPTPGQPSYELDPFSDEFGQQMQQRDQHLLAQIQQMIQPIAGSFQQLQQQAAMQAQAESDAVGEQSLQDMLAGDIARNGEFHPVPEVDREIRDEVRQRADRLYMEMASGYGGHDFVLQAGIGRRLAEQAMTQAAQQTRDKYRRITSTAVQTEDNRRATLYGVPNEPGSGAAGVPGTPRFNSPSEATEYYARRARALNT